MLVAKGIDGTIEFDGSTVWIQKKQFLTARGKKAVSIAAVQAVQFKEPGLTSGFLQVVFTGSGEAKGGVFEATRDENAILFTNGHKRAFLDMRDSIQAAVLERSRPQAASPVALSAADEIERFAGLRDKGHITAEEFDAKKKQLLGL